MPQVIPDKIPCQTLQQFSTEASTLKDVLDLEETEETWDRMERGLMRFSAVIRGGGYQFKKELIDVLKSLQRAMISALNSERTRLSAAVLDCISVVAPRIGLDFEPLVSVYVPPILRLSTRTNKVYVTRSRAAIALIIGYCHIPSIIPHLLMACKESKITTGRSVAIDSILRALNKWDWSQKEFRSRVANIEEAIRLTGRDKDASIRQISRQVFEAYKKIFPERLDEFVAPLTPVMRKYLEIKAEERGRPMTKNTPSGAMISASGDDNEANALGLRVRSTSSRRQVENRLSPAKSKDTRPRPVSVQTMPPPATVPSKDITRSKSPSSQEDRGNQERQRLLSSMSSTFSVKSVPPSSKPLVDHRPPVRLASSQSRSVSVTKPVLTSTGSARRIRRVISIEQTNRPDLFAIAKKAAVRTLVQSGPREESTADHGGVPFPMSDTRNPGMERRGAQRVPKPPPPPSAPSDNKDDHKSENPHEPPVPPVPIPKNEVKPSIFRRALSADAKGDQKAKRGFAPRRGGVLQPTMSQLNKQRPPVSNTQARLRVISHSTLKRSGTQKATNLTSSKSSAELVKPTTGESNRIQDEKDANNLASELLAVPEPEEQAQTVISDELETKQRNDGLGITIPELELLVESPERDTSAAGAKDNVDGSTVNQTEDEVRSSESTPPPQTPSPSIMVSKETDKQVWENIEIASEVARDANDISVNNEATTMIPENDDKSSDQLPLVEVLVTE